MCAPAAIFAAIAMFALASCAPAPGSAMVFDDTKAFDGTGPFDYSGFGLPQWILHFSQDVDLFRSSGTAVLIAPEETTRTETTFTCWIRSSHFRNSNANGWIPRKR